MRLSIGDDVHGHPIIQDDLFEVAVEFRPGKLDKLRAPVGIGPSEVSPTRLNESGIDQVGPVVLAHGPYKIDIGRAVATRVQIHGCTSNKKHRAGDDRRYPGDEPQATYHRVRFPVRRIQFVAPGPVHLVAIRVRSPEVSTPA